MKWVEVLFCILAGLAGAAIGLMAGYYALAYAGCAWFWPNSNLCGIVGVPSGLLGALAGLTFGAWGARTLIRRRSSALQ